MGTGKKASRREQELRQKVEELEKLLAGMREPFGDGETARLELADLIDAAALQKLMDEFYALAHIPMSIIDDRGRVLVGVGWQEVCTQFHRVQPETCQNCVESDTHLSAGLAKGEYRLYKCRNNLWDMATPIVVAGQHVGNIFTGQFFFDDETIDVELFRAQARKYGFDEQAYLDALHRVPRLSRETVNRGLAFFLKLADMLSQLGHTNLRLARLLTERDRLTDSLHKSEARMRLAQEIAHVGTFEVDLRTGVNVWTPELEAMHGIRVGGFAADRPEWDSLIHPDDRAGAMSLMNQSLETGIPTEGEWRVVWPDGSVHWLAGRWQVLKDDSGRPVRMTGINIDITERKRTEKALRESEERFRVMFEGHGAAMLLIEPETGAIIDANLAAARFYGYSREQLRSMRIDQINELPAEAVAAERRKALDLIQTRFIFFHRLANGQVRCVEVYSSPVAIQGRSMLFSIIHDVTARRNAEQALRESEQKFRSAFAHAAIGFSMTTPDGRFVDANSAYCAITGYDIEDLRTRVSRQLIHPEDFAQNMKLIDRMLEGGINDFVVENRYFRKDGRTVCVRKSMSLVRDQEGAPQWIIALVEDVTERKKAEEDLRRTARELERSNEDLQQFAYVASHDLQEPLRTISGFLKLLNDRYGSRMDDKAAEYIGYTVDASTRMSQLISDLLAYSRVDRKGRELEPTDAGAALDGALANLGGMIQEAGATVTHAPMPSVMGDSSQILQLFQNLIGNAVKFRSGERPCRVHLDARQRSTEWEFSVEDNGIGIAPDHFDRIFLMFQRLHSRDKYPGTGIGLSICKRIIERHGGRIWVESRPDQGSTFRFTLPGVGPR